MTKGVCKRYRSEYPADYKICGNKKMITYFCKSQRRTGRKKAHPAKQAALSLSWKVWSGFPGENHTAPPADQLLELHHSGLAPQEEALKAPK